MDLNASVATVLENLECPCCYEYMTGHIFNCTQGHSICGNCRNLAKQCPTCNSPLSNVRNFTLESIGSQIRYPCLYQAHGCTHSHQFNRSMQDHIQECDFRKYKCILNPNCKWLGLRSEIRAHSVQKHSFATWMGEDNLDRWQPTNPDVNVQLATAFNEIFCVTRKLIRDQEMDTMFWFVQYIGNTSDLNLYSYKICIFNDEDVGLKRRQITFVNQCQSDLVSLNELMEIGECAAVHMPILNSFLGSKTYVSFQVTLSKHE